ncbi:MAG: HlyD family secretion protein [Desulfobacteraceae bacterium Eth-SRB2]|nr:MAG: HlyD family secretion protein [Desulfobacteraceae bacterium Eth-SRB2]
MININHKENNNIGKILGVDRSSKQNRRLKLWAGIIIVLLATISAVIAFSYKNTGSTQRYRTQKAERGNLIITVTATGTLEPTNEVDVGVEVSGTIKTVEADYNQRVKTGQVLARLDTSKLMAQVLQAKAALKSARAKVLRARADVRQTNLKLAQFQKARKSSGGKVPSQAEMDGAEAALARAQADEASALADVSKAEAELTFNETNLSKATIRSPIDGIVLLRRVEPGQTVAASLQTPVLFTIAEDLTKMELHVDVDEADVGQVKANQTAVFTVDAYPNRNFSAQVTEVRFSPRTVQGVVTYETALAVDNQDLALLPGMTATADIVVKHIEDALLIPNAALRFMPPGKHEEAKKKNRGLLGALLPHRPKKSSGDKKDKYLLKGKQRLVWILSGGKPVSLSVTTGATDGRMTEVLAENITPGLELLIDVVRAKNE